MIVRILRRRGLGSYPPRTAGLKQQVQVALDVLGLSSYDVALALVPPAEMRDENLHFRHRDRPTDVLAFPFHENVSLEYLQHAEFAEDRRVLGDILICPPFVEAQCSKANPVLQLAPRVTVLAVHGLCHLAGFTHDRSSDERVMHAMEDRIVASLSKQWRDTAEGVWTEASRCANSPGS